MRYDHVNGSHLEMSRLASADALVGAVTVNTETAPWRELTLGLVVVAVLLPAAALILGGRLRRNV